jgi:hypothetical protein
MPFTYSSFRVRAGSIELAQDKRTKALMEAQVLRPYGLIGGCGWGPFIGIDEGMR